MNGSFNRLESEDLEALRSDGICLKTGFFSSDVIAVLRETSLRMRQNSLEHRNPARRWLLLSPSYALRKSVNRAFRDDLVYLSNVAIGSGFRELAAEYYGEAARLNHIMSIESPRSEDAITVWHTDANSKPDNPLPSDVFILKCFIYLNDINISNGAFAYIRGSHKIVTAIREGIFRKTIARCKTGLIPELLEVLASDEAREFLIKQFSGHELDEFSFALSEISEGRFTDGAYSLSGPAGTLLVFDDRGVHRGGVPRDGHRSILRYNYQQSKYWKGAYSPLRYAMNMACKLFLPRSIGRNW